MELESKSPDSLHPNLNDDESHKPNLATTFPSHPTDENTGQDHASPDSAGNHHTPSTSMSGGNFDEMPLPAKANLTFEEMLEVIFIPTASLKSSSYQANEPSGRKEPISRPPKPKAVSSRLNKGGTAKKPRAQDPMEEETSLANEPSGGRMKPVKKMGSDQDKMRENVPAQPEEDLLDGDNGIFQNIGMEEEKSNKSPMIQLHQSKSQQEQEEPSAEFIDSRFEEVKETSKTFMRKNTGESDLLGKVTSSRVFENFEETERTIQPGGDHGFDETPVGKGAGAYNISEYPEGMQPLEEEQSQQDSGPLQNRVKSKVWKIRQTAFEELTQKFQAADKNDSIFDEYVSELVKFLADSNPGSQEKAIEAFKVYVEKKDGSGIDAKNAVKTLMDKALASGKPNIRKICLETLCVMFERMDKREIIEGLADSIGHKNQKVSCASVQAVVELLQNYGPKKLEFLKLFFPPIEKLAASTVSSQRSEAMNFYKEAYKFMGEAMKPFISKLKKAQIDELEKFFSECPKELARPLKGGDVAGGGEGSMGRSGASGGAKGSVSEESGMIDAYEFAEAVDLFKKFNDTWSEKVLAKEKWSEKKQMMEELLKEVTNTPRIANTTPFHHITNMLKKLLNDSNQNVMMTAVKIYGALAKGLRRNLSNACKNIMPTILGKLKDKRQVVVDEAAKTLENFLYCISLDEVGDDVKEVLAEKAPGPKIQVLKWIEKFFEKNTKSPDKVSSVFKMLIPTLKKLLEDGAAEVREATIVTLARLKVLVPEAIVKDSYNDINPSKLTRINELSTNISEGGGGLDSTGKGNANLSSSMGKKNKPNLSISGDNIEEEKSAIKRPVSRAGDNDAKKLDSKPLTSRANAAGAKQIQGGLKKVDSTKNLGTVSSSTEASSNLSADEAEAKMMELNLPETISKGLDDAQWKERQRAVEEFGTFIKDNASSVAPYIEHAFKFLRTKLKDWKEGNLNVIKEALQTVLAITGNPEIQLTKKSFSLVAPLVVSNLHDPKYKDICFSIITSFVEAINPKIVILSIVNNFQESKDAKVSKVNPKALAEACALLVKLVELLTISYFPLKETIDFSKATLANQNVAARNGAISLLKAIYQQLGPSLNDFLNDINPQTLKTVNAELEKVIPNKNVQCKIQFRGEAQLDIKEQGGAPSNPLDSLPRADISKDVDKLLKKLNDNDWKVRKEGLEALEGIIAANNNRIAPNGLQELITCLKNRLNDNNKSLLKSCIQFVGTFATALGPNVKIYSKTLVVELIRNLSDKQAVIRTETLASLDKFAAEIGSEAIINNAFPALSQENPELRLTLIPWILRNQESLAKVDLKGSVSVVLSILQDKTKEIRTLGEKLLEKCIAVVGPAPYSAALKDLKPAIQKALIPLIQKYSGQTTTMTEPDMDLDGSFDQKQGQKTLKKTPSESNLKPGKPGMRPGTAGSFSSVENPIAAQESTTKKPERATSPKKSSTPNASMSNIQVSTPSNSGFNSSRNASNGVICLLGQKSKRQEEEKKARWNTEELKDDLVERLKEHLKRNVSGDLHQKMFSFDARKQKEAVQTLKKALVQEFQGTIDILDLIIKWLFFRLWDNANMEVTKEALDYVYNLTFSLEAAKYTFEDFELNVLVPFLLQKLSTGQQNSKLTLYKIFTKLGEIASSQRICGLIMQAVLAKNTKTRNEGLEVLLVMVKEFKADAMSQKDIKALGKLLGSTEASLKNASFNVLVELGPYMKDELIRVLKGEAPQKSLDMLQQRIKMSEGSGNRLDNKRGYSDDFTGNADEENMFGSFKGQNVVSGSLMFEKESPYDPEVVENREFGNFKYNNNTTTVRDKTESTSTMDPRDNVRETRDNSLLGTPQNPNKGIHVVGGQKIEEELFDRSLNLLVSGSIPNRLDALLLIHDIVTADNEETREFLKIKANDLVRTLYVTLKNVFEKPKSEIPIKFVIYFLNMTHKLCSIRSFLKNITEENLKIFSEEILNRLLIEDEEKRFESAANESPVKTLNSIMLRVLENSEPDIMFNVLFDLLIKNRQKYGFVYAKILGLIVKCILKLTKALSQIANTLHPERILLKFHLYILEFGAKLPEDIGIKTIKQLLHELIKTYGEEIWEFYARSVQHHPNRDEYIHKWISVILRHIESGVRDEHFQELSDKATPERRESGDYKQNRQENMPGQFAQNSAYNSDVFDSKTFEIKQIIEGLKTLDDLEGGIRELYRTLQKYPGLSVTPYLKNCTLAFSDYIVKALERMESRENASRGQSGMQTNTESLNRLKFDEGAKFGGAAQQTSNSPKNTGQLSLEDFQNKVNTLKVRYGLILKKSTETQEPSKPSQTTLVYKTSQTNNRESSREQERSFNMDSKESSNKEPITYGAPSKIGQYSGTTFTTGPSETYGNTGTVSDIRTGIGAAPSFGAGTSTGVGTGIGSGSGLGTGFSFGGSNIGGTSTLGSTGGQGSIGAGAKPSQGDAAGVGRSTENILQRLNEMKMKMASIVNSNKTTN